MQQAVNISPLVHSDTGALRLSPYICCSNLSTSVSVALFNKIQLLRTSTMHRKAHSFVPMLSPALFSWQHMWPVNHPEKWEKASYISYVIKLQGVDSIVM